MKSSTLLPIVLAAGALAAGPADAAIDINSDPILYWNDRGVTLFTANSGLQTRGLAMANIAMFDAVNSIVGHPSSAYLAGVTGFGGDTRAAVAQAAHDVLTSVNSANAAQYAAALNASLAAVPDGPDKTNGRATGAAFAAAIIAARAGDGFNNPAGVTYTSTNLPGDYRVTTGGAAVLPFWGDVTPFLLSSTNDVRPGPPPALDSAAYAAAYNEVKALGSLTSSLRNADQTASALFWDASTGTTWLRAGLTIAEDEGLSTLGFAQVFARLSTALADSLIVSHDAKYDYRLWRPVTAIQLGDIDGNPATAGDPNWSPLFPTPGHPSYISNHSTFSGAGSVILLDAFGEEPFGFSIGPDSRSFTGIAQAAQDAGNSRLWGGIHFSFDNQVGLATGQSIGQRVLAARAFAAPVPEPSTWAMLLGGFAMIGVAFRRQRARAGNPPVPRHIPG